MSYNVSLINIFYNMLLSKNIIFWKCLKIAPLIFVHALMKPYQAEIFDKKVKELRQK